MRSPLLALVVALAFSSCGDRQSASWDAKSLARFERMRAATVGAERKARKQGNEDHALILESISALAFLRAEAFTEADEGGSKKAVSRYLDQLLERLRQRQLVHAQEDLQKEMLQRQVGRAHRGEPAL